MPLNEEMRTSVGVMKVIAWLKENRRPILADEMERELLHVNRQQPEAQQIQHPPCSIAS